MCGNMSHGFAWITIIYYCYNPIEIVKEVAATAQIQ